MNDKQLEIIKHFLLANPEIMDAKWNGILTIYFLHKPQEPFTLDKFMSGSPTYRLLNTISKQLLEAS